MLSFEKPDELKAFASRLAAHVTAPDFIGLVGDLGAGKTVFAQGLLSGLGVRERVTSPTYQIVHPHQSERGAVYHCDFYRLDADHAQEIGLDEMREAGVVVAEWANRVGELPQNRLSVEIEGDGDVRHVSMRGFGSWDNRLVRFIASEAFLLRHGWNNAACLAVKGDASSRTFARVQRQVHNQPPETAMLMDWPNKTDGPPIRHNRSYDEIAGLARDGRSFLALSDWLRKAGISAPTVLAVDIDAGFYLVEDLGDDVFGDLVKQGHLPEPLYALATEGLLAIRQARPAQTLSTSLSAEPFRLKTYAREAKAIELDLLLDWYIPFTTGRECPTSARDSFTAQWSQHLDWLDFQERSLVLRDYHSPNLIYCPNRDGLRRLGVIDFQDAMWGHPAYDLMSLLQDARLTVSPELEAELLKRYCAGAAQIEPAFDASSFYRAYAILGAQRNTKILGIFARLSMRDHKDGYLTHLPRIRDYLVRNLNHIDLVCLQGWYAQERLRTNCGGRNAYPA